MNYPKMEHKLRKTGGHRTWQRSIMQQLEIGEKPERKCWYEEGIQLCEREEIDTEGENGYDHISIAVDSVEETMEKIKVYPVKEINDHWFSLPNGTKIELKLLENWKVNK